MQDHPLFTFPHSYGEKKAVVDGTGQIALLPSGLADALSAASSVFLRIDF